MYAKIQSLDDLHELQLQQIAHFFERYKDLEKGKWVKVKGWEGKDAAHKEILDGVANFNKA
jgi:inorganic pyrophosphatase